LTVAGVTEQSRDGDSGRSRRPADGVGRAPMLPDHATEPQSRLDGSDRILTTADHIVRAVPNYSA
jgi:hypothetical protein